MFWRNLKIPKRQNSKKIPRTSSQFGTRPILFVDVDGVISLFGFTPDVHKLPGPLHWIDGVAHCIPDSIGERLSIAIPGKRLDGRIEDENTLVTVEQDVVAVVQQVRDAMQAHHRRQAQRAGDDRGVRRLAPQLDRETEHMLAVDTRPAA